MTTPTPPPAAGPPTEPLAWAAPVSPPPGSGLLQVALVAVAVIIGGVVTFMMLGARPGAYESIAPAGRLAASGPTADLTTTAAAPATAKAVSGWSRENEYR